MEQSTVQNDRDRAMAEGSDLRDNSPSGQFLLRDEERNSGARRNSGEGSQTDASEQEKNDGIPSDTLRRAPYIVFLTLGYAAIAIFGWVVMCILAYRPIGGRGYSLDTQSGIDDSVISYVNGFAPVSDWVGSLAQSDRFLRAARVLQSVASVLTVPLTSMVCSCAAVAFLQRRRTQSSRGLTLRQSMALADKGWIDPVLIAKLFAGGWKQYGSLFLVIAMVLNLVGVSVTPLQGLVVSYESIKVPTNLESMEDLMDLPKMLRSWENRAGTSDTMELRSRLMSAQNEDPQFKLWSSEPGCGGGGSEDDKSNWVCTASGQYTIGSMPTLSNPFWAQPPSSFNTGIWRQFAPRINLTSKYETITADAFPDDCSQIPDALSLHYENMTAEGGYIVDVCMPANVTQSPWKATRARQDFSEELYVRMTLDWKVEMEMDSISFVPGNYSFKVTLDTTAGYFELPNYQNRQLPGPLLDDGPDLNCGLECDWQDFPAEDEDLTIYDTPPEDAETDNTMDSLFESMRKGPLLSTTLALFGPGSYLDTRHTLIEAYQDSPMSKWANCVDIVPFIRLLYKPDGELPSYELLSGDLEPCVSGFGEGARIGAAYAYLFASDEENTYVSLERIQDAFAAAAFLAVDVWVSHATEDHWQTASLNWDMGADHQVPEIPRVGMILVSILLGVYLTSLLGLSVYTAWTPRWTNQLDAFAVMRISAGLSNRFPLRLANNPDKVKELDELPGWIGGVNEVKDYEKGDKQADEVGELGLGGEVPVRERKRYRCYAIDEPTKPPWYRRALDKRG